MLTFTVEIPIQEKIEEHWILAKESNHEVSKAGVREQVDEINRGICLDSVHTP